MLPQNLLKVEGRPDLSETGRQPVLCNPGGKAHLLVKKGAWGFGKVDHRANLTVFH
jgi:hypothetical protein